MPVRIHAAPSGVVRFRLLIVALVTVISTTACSAPPPVPLALGAFISGAPGDAETITAYATLIGTAPRVVMWYQDWTHPDSRTFHGAQMDAAYIRGAMPMVTWEPWDATGGPNQPLYALRLILAGSYDGYIHQWARDAALWNRPFYLRLAHEMNGTNYPWTPFANGNTAHDYVLMWQHVWEIFRQEGATNVRWVWTPSVTSPGTAPIESLYPGDRYVDWVGLDGYNWGTSQTWSHWTDLVSVFAPSYRTLAALTAKPMMFAETASAEAGGDKAHWITQGLLSDIPTHFPRVRAVIWFNEEKETDWRMNSSPAALAAYRTVAQSPLYQGTLP